ncbi:hypothetical protein HME9304_02718 [Flagellimonas maritima]|uniref:Cytochrome c domain-containing protein n=1 Tax=Flagellimonas maritima TaxID=1383885 RepID=A0A2Z4LUX6_9FLAO|nr:cytochrome c [Allomuricauda aurantiaca]AWX45691.1 hypothetical protein HME9304_02718 [Allomuricauda aurantiaca]
MKINITIYAMLSILFLVGCGGKEEKKKDGFSVDRTKSNEKVEKIAPETNEVPASQRITLDNKGVGQIKEITLGAEIDEDMAIAGSELFKTNCTACHKTDKRFIGPKMQGILDRRSPEWVMNMILDPKLMTEEDRCAKDLLVEFNGAAMANQNLTVEESRALLEYFRTL